MGIKLWISLTTNVSHTWVPLVKAELALLRAVRRHESRIGRLFPPCLPSVCPRDPSAPPQNQLLLIEMWRQSGGCGNHVSHWWFMSNRRSAGRTKRSNRPVHRPPTPQRCREHTFLSSFSVIFLNWWCIPTGKHRHVKNSYDVVGDKGKPHKAFLVVTQRITLGMAGGVCVHVCEVCACVWGQSWAATQQQFLVLSHTVTLKFSPKFDRPSPSTHWLLSLLKIYQLFPLSISRTPDTPRYNLYSHRCC